MVTRAKPKAGQNRVGMMVRIAPDIRERLEQSAEKAGRSLGQEVELRLDRSFELVSIIDSTIKQTLSAAVELTREGLAQTEGHLVNMVGGDDLFLLWAKLSFVIREVEYETGKSIREDEETRNRAERELLGAIPGLFRKLPEPYSEFKKRSATNLAEGGGTNALAALHHKAGALPPLGYVGPWPPRSE